MVEWAFTSMMEVEQSGQVHWGSLRMPESTVMCLCFSLQSGGMLWRSSSIVCFPCLCVVKQLSRLAKQFRTRVLLLLVLLISPVTFLGWIHLHEAFLDMDTQTKVADYMHWWRMVCENATLHLREEAALQGLPLCPCFGKAPLSSMDGIGILGEIVHCRTSWISVLSPLFTALLPLWVVGKCYFGLYRIL